MIKTNEKQIVQVDETQIVAICPTTHKRVIGRLWERQQFFGDYSSDRQVIWWYCSTCQNWHALFVEEETVATN
ncbi:MAG: hypothetical protein AAF485_16625 [Chloroflexota bacterium]